MTKQSSGIWTRISGGGTVAMAAGAPVGARRSWAEPARDLSIAADPDAACALHNLAASYQDSGHDAKAEPLYRRVLAITESALGPDHPILACSLHNLAALYQARGDCARAEPLLRRALSIREEALGPDHPAVAESLGNLAVLHLARGKISQAIRLTARATDIEDWSTARLLAAGLDEPRSAHSAIPCGTTDGVVSLHVQLAPDIEDAKRLALMTILRRKVRGLEFAADRGSGLRRRLPKGDQAQFDRWRALCAAHRALSLRGPDTLPIGEFRDTLAELQAQAQAIEAEWTRRSAEIRVALQPVTIEEVQAAIPDGAALVELFRYAPFNPRAAKLHDRWGTPRYVAYVLRRRGAITWADLGEARPIDAAVHMLLAALRDRTADAEPFARELDRRILQPIRRLLGETRRVLVSRDGPLNLVPFSVLASETGESRSEQVAFSYVTSGRELVRRAAMADRAAAPRTR